MKKTIISVFVLALVFSALGAAAKETSSEAKDVKIHKKQMITDAERKAMDDMAKGKGSSGKSNTFQSLATGIIGGTQPFSGQKYAIVVGLGNYEGTVNDLCATASKTNLPYAWNIDPANPQYYCQDYDSVYMADTLKNIYGYDADKVHILRDGQATKSEIINKMEIVKGLAGPNDEVLFFFSGHGTSGRISGDNESLDEAAFTYDNNFLWDDELKAWADSLHVNRQIYIFDICLAGGMSDIAGSNRVVAMSSAETRNSYTYTIGGALVGGAYKFSEGLFSHYFDVVGMQEKKADASNLLKSYDQKVAVEEAFSYTYPIIKSSQTPVLNDRFANDLWLGH